MAAFVAVFSAKFAHDDGVGSYFPPFDEESLCFFYLLFLALAVYFLVRSEVVFWRWHPSGNATPSSSLTSAITAMK